MLIETDRPRIKIGLTMSLVPKLEGRFPYSAEDIAKVYLSNNLKTVTNKRHSENVNIPLRL